ncbi:L-aspartate oxidase [Methylocystis heyeri]|uniref:L-aspartate oxidase n=1 Tax=Methylocystis heyeri TaxID=391905 RepID=A0A6B8KDI7_9HYPH|nr:L-aspartate oxidase [Methylocystis heyeri]QGM45085.1 L-aspartate oxidase [Methylocystis heyeri]
MERSYPPILIVGGGLAGVFCALKLAPSPVAILAPSGVGGASSWAQGGVAAAVSEGDTPETHAADTVAAGAGIVDADIALGVAMEARARIEDLAAYGAPFDRDAQGLLQPSREAAHTHRRIVRVKGDVAGRAIMETLARQVRETPSIEVIEGVTAYDIVMAGGRVAGICGHDAEGRERFIPCRALVLATGGVGHLYRVTTNPLDACGAGVAMAARVGAHIADAEFVQFHPTAIDIGVDPAPLATESLRGEGALIVDRDGRRFLLDADPAAELAPRDIVARAVFSSIAQGKGAFLDARAAVGEHFPARFPTVYASCMGAGIDPVKDAIPIAPAAHYHMGGIATDANGRTTVAGLWAAGEVGCTGLHGANRLASNSLLEALVVGARVAVDILCSDALNQSVGAPADLPRFGYDPNEGAVIEELRDVMASHVGVVRDGAGLSLALERIARLGAQTKSSRAQNMLTTAMLIASAGFVRRESRGAHFRSDYPESSAAFAKRSRFTLGEAQEIARRAAP